MLETEKKLRHHISSGKELQQVGLLSALIFSALAAIYRKVDPHEKGPMVFPAVLSLSGLTLAVLTSLRLSQLYGSLAQLIEQNPPENS